MEILTIQFVNVSSAVTCDDAEIQQRIAESPKGKRTTQYVAYENGKTLRIALTTEQRKKRGQRGAGVRGVNGQLRRF